MRNFYRRGHFLFSPTRIILVLFLFFNHAFSQPVLSFNPVINSGLGAPVDLVNAGDGSNRIFVVQQGGTIRVYNQSFTYLGDFLTVTGISTGGERGLLSMAFSPSYSTNGFFYVYYTNASGDVEVARYHVSADPNVADASSKAIVITIPHPVNANHNGGKLNFGVDGYLYFATGDGGGGGDVPNNAQNGMVLLGKMLRLNVNNSASPPYYTIPADNPYVSDPNVLDEIWAMGLRNPFRWSFDKQTNDLWIGDVGQDAWEEIDYRAAGTTGGINYGWHCYEGNATYNTSGCAAPSNYVFPIYVYPNPSSGSSAVTGGVVYRGSMYPVLQGYYIAADVYSSDVFLVKPDGSGGWTITTQSGLPGPIVCFGEAENAEVYAVSLGGTVYNVTSSSVLPIGLISFSAIPANGAVNLSWKVAGGQDIQLFNIEYSTDGIHFQQVGSVGGRNTVNDSTYRFTHIVSYSSTIFYRLKMINSAGTVEYSNIISINGRKQNSNFIYPSIISSGSLNLYLDESFHYMQLVNSTGAIVLKQDINGQTGHINIPVQASTGIYIAQLISNNKTISQRVVIQ